MCSNRYYTIFFQITSEIQFNILDKPCWSFYSLCPVLHSKTGGSKDQFLYENIVASYGLQQIGLKIEVTNHQNFEIFNFSDWAPALSIACHDAFFCLKHTHIISCKKKKKPLRDKHSRVRISFGRNETFQTFFYFPREDKLTFTFQFFLHEVLFNVYLVGNFL